MRRTRQRHRLRQERNGANAFEPEALSGLFSAPLWLRELGASAWLAVGVTLFVVGVVWLLALTQTIVAPVIAAAVVAAVAGPLVSWLERHHVKRGLGAALLLVTLAALAAGVVFVVLAGITSQFDDVRSTLAAAKDTIAGWLSDLGVARDTATNATKDASSAVSSAIPALLEGLAAGLKHLSSLVFFLSLTALSLFFLLKDGPEIRGWGERHMRVPPVMAHQMSGRMLESLRGYFLGVTIVAAFNAVVVGIGALLLGVPLAGTIAAVTFLGAYIPYLGAWTAGAFSVLMALGGAGSDAAVGMIIIQLLANGLLQQMVQPIAYGTALGIHPLAVLIVTIAGGALFGAVGLILAAPVTAALTRIAEDIRRGRATSDVAPPPGAAPAPPVGAAT
jgi:predicted PurR-regulated permease PerM